MAAAKDELNLPLIVTIGILFVILLFVLILLMQAYFFEQQREEFIVKVVEPRSDALVSALADQEAKLNNYRWIDQQKGVVGIPIESAMELVVREGVRSVRPPAAPAEGSGSP
jgi:hypothetical protein